ncbi:MAG: ribose-5-phosphate isomerase RpiA [Planctomycetaceae bacterium]
MTIFDRALSEVTAGMTLGLGSGRASQSFVRALAARVGEGLAIRGVPTSVETEQLARELKVPLVTLAEAGQLDLTVDGADEVDPAGNLIKGYGRALLREKIVAASSRRLIILVGTEKLVPRLGTRGRLPVEIVPFGLTLCQRRLRELGCEPVLYERNGQPHPTDNGNYILDCQVGPLANPEEWQTQARRIPGVVDTGLFLDLADLVLVGDSQTLEWQHDLRPPRAATA